MTRLKALELFGFKSFADRTRFEFPDGITVVVGPNGSGKSNVVDAMKWVLGEQSVRSLRGKEMTDVIFAGSVSRKPLGSAETTLVFDNSARLLPVDADEVQVGRRVYRSGESEYLLNGEVCRLKDVRELFSGTGAATEAYSVIEQGRVDALLTASGKDRRAVFEEAAGITRFRTRRIEALRRLERAEQNRQRLADIVGEVAARLETVRHQAARARRWRQMTDRLKSLRIVAARQDLAEVDSAVAAVEEALLALQAAAAAADSMATGAAAEAAAKQDEDRSLVPEAERLQALVADRRELAAGAAARLEPLRQRVAEREADLAAAASAARGAATRLHEATREAASCAAEADSIGAEVGAWVLRLEECERVAAGSHGDVSAARGRLGAIATRSAELSQHRQRLLIEADRADTRGEEYRRSAGEWRTKVDAARRRAAAADEALAAREGNVDALLRRAADTSAAILRAEGDVRERTTALEGGWRDLAGWQAKLEACGERKRVIEEIASRHEGLAEAARRLLADADAAAGVRGVVGESIDAPLEWAGLVDVALGAAAQDIEVDSLDAFAGWLDAWAATESGALALAGGGRVGIVATAADPLSAAPFAAEKPGKIDEVVATDDVARPAELAEADSPTPVAPAATAGPRGEPGVVGRLDLLVAGEAAPPAGRAARLLARTWVVESFETARRLAPRLPDLLFVSRDGRTCRGGRIEIGTAAAASGLVTRRAELKALVERHEELAARVVEHGEAVTRLQEALAEAGQVVRQLQSRRQQEAEAVAEGRADASRLARERDAATEAIATAEKALLDAERRAAEETRQRDGVGERLSAADAELAALVDERHATEAAIADIDRSRGSLVEEIQRLRILIATGRDRHARAGEESAARLRAVAERDGARAEAEERVLGSRRRLEEAELELLATGQARSEAAWAAERAEEAFQAIATRQALLRGAAARAGADADAARAEGAALGERIHARELEAGESRHRRVRIVERIRDEYDIDIESLAESGPATAESTDEPVPDSRAELDSAIEELRRKLASMTTVNLEALAESEQLAERLAGLEAQLADVTGAKDSIEQLIARIDDESRRLLAETFEVVRGHFRTLFERVFGGGQADIVLEPGVDVLETSVEIVARPPGKEPRSISLLSGGEKTMTCVALLLAIFRSRPSPFCVLDEVDAALDEANVDRFVGVLREFTNTQIIVVTHRKATMAAADTLYGVTMEESGVSKRVSVRFENAAAMTKAPSRAAA